MSLEEIDEVLRVALKQAISGSKKVMPALVEAQRQARKEQLAISNKRAEFAQAPTYTLLLKNIMHL